MLTIFGASAVAAMPVRYALEARSPWFVFAFGLTPLWRLRLWMACGRVAFGVIEWLWASLPCADGAERKLPKNTGSAIRD